MGLSHAYPSNPWGDYPLSFWDKRPELEAPLFQRIKELILRKGTVVELGCGTGKLCELLTPETPYYQGIDLAEQAIKEAKRKYPRHSFYVGDFRDSQWPATLSSGTTVISCNVLDHHPHFERGLHRMLEIATERVIVTFANPLFSDGRIQYRPDGTYNNVYSLVEIANMLSYYGWFILGNETHDRYTDQHSPSSLLLVEKK